MAPSAKRGGARCSEVQQYLQSRLHFIGGFGAVVGVLALFYCAELVLPRLIAPLRLSLMSSDLSVVEAGMDALMQLSCSLVQCSKGDSLNDHLPVLLVQLTKRPQLREKATRVLEMLEQSGGHAAYAAIKSKVPTYCSVTSF